MQTNIRILIVEDEAITVHWMKVELSKYGYNIDAVSTGKKALESIQQHLPDIIIMDIHIAGDMDGLATMKQIRSIHPIPVIFVTGYQNEKIIRAAEAFNPLKILTKPFFLDEIHRIITEYFAQGKN